MGRTSLLLGATALLFGTFGASAQLAEPLADLNTGIGVTSNSGPGEFVKVTDSLTIFVATDRVHGTELWRTDGTTVGTVLVADVCPGLCGSFPTKLTRLGNHIYFSADDGQHGNEPWRIDTTTLVSNLVGDVSPGAGSSFPEHYVQANLTGATAVYFTAIPIESGTTRNFYLTSGTPAGTSLAVATTMGSFTSVVGTGSRIYFAATETSANQGRELYRLRFVNGSHAVQLTADMNPGAASSNPQSFTQVGNLLFFTADDGTRGRELWVQDLVGEALTLVEDIIPGTEGSSPAELTAFAGALFFVADNAPGASNNRELWKSDGTAPGTDILLEIDTSTNVGSNPTLLRVAASQLIFLASAFSTGKELYRSNGTAAGTAIVKDQFPGNAGFGFSNQAVAVGASYYFIENSQLWATDGTAPSVRTVGTPFGFVTALGDGGARVYVAAGQEGVGNEPFRSTLGTNTHVLLRNIGEEIGHSDPFGFTARGANTVFAAFDDSVGTEPRVASGPGLPVPLLAGDATPGSLFSSLFSGEAFEPAGNLLFFALNQNELWSSDGTTPGTAPVIDFATQPVDGAPRCLLGDNAQVVFYLDPDDSEDTDQVWRSDGTLGGTLPLVSDPAIEQRNTECFGGERNIAVLGGNVFFVARSSDGLTGFELYRSNGTGSATLVRDIRPGPDSSLPQRLLVVGNTLYFSANGGEGIELWKSNGTAQGTVLVKDINPASNSSPRDLRAFNGMLAFTANDGTSGRELYVSDGTSAGTQRVVDLHAGAGSAFGTSALLAVSGGSLYFAATETTALGSQLYRSNGTAPGTVRLTNQAGGLAPQDLAPIGNGWIMFSGATPATGRELWFSNGTVAGTIPLQDIAAGPASSSPRNLALGGDYVYFSADDGTTGREPWVIAAPSDFVFDDSFE